jgi:hypothetical protein
MVSRGNCWLSVESEIRFRSLTVIVFQLAPRPFIHFADKAVRFMEERQRIISAHSTAINDGLVPDIEHFHPACVRPTLL